MNKWIFSQYGLGGGTSMATKRGTFPQQNFEPFRCMPFPAHDTNIIDLFYLNETHSLGRPPAFSGAPTGSGAAGGFAGPSAAAGTGGGAAAPGEGVTPAFVRI